MSIEISVVIPCRTRDPFIEKTLLSLTQQKNCNFEVILVFNPEIVLISMKDLNYPLKITKSQVGANCARNAGLRMAQADLVLFLDSDCQVSDSTFLSQYINHMNANPKLTGCGGTYQIKETQNKFAKGYQSIQDQWICSGILDNTLRTQNLFGGNMVIRKSRIQNEFFDEQLIFGGTEQEFIFRLIKKQHVLTLLPQQKVLHDCPVSFYSLLFKAFKQGQGKLYLEKKLNVKIEQKSLHLEKTFINNYITQLYKIAFQIGNQSFFKNRLNEFRYILVDYYYQWLVLFQLIKTTKQSKN